jgi:hypothetical protein
MPDRKNGQTVRYDGRTFRNITVTQIEQDTENRSVDTEYGHNLTYGCVDLQEEGTFVVIQRRAFWGDYWLVTDTI